MTSAQHTPEHSPEHTPEHRELIALANQIMPFGKYKGDLLLDLPEPYLVWFHGEGWPGGALGERMAAMYEVKVNGLEKLLRPLVGVAVDAASESNLDSEEEPTHGPESD